MVINGLGVGGRRRVRVRGVVVVIAAAIAVGALAGCSQDPPPAATPQRTAATTSATPSATPTATAPTVPAAAKAGTRAGAEAFYNYFWQVYNYSFASLDTSVLRRFSDPGCDFCVSQADAIDRHRTEGGRYVGGRVTVITVVAAPNDPRRAILVTAALSQEASTTLSAEGGVIQRAPAKDALTINAALRWTGKTWTVLKIGAEATGGGEG